MYGQQYQQDGQQGSSSAGPYAPPPNFTGGPAPQGPAPQGYGGPTPQGYGGPAQSFQQGGGPAHQQMGGPAGPATFHGSPTPHGYMQPGAQPLMGQSPMPMGYDPQMGQFDAQSFAMQQDPRSFAVQQAEADLAAMEEKKKAKEEASKKRDVEHLSKNLRSGARDHKDNQACARTLCLWALLNGLLYGIALMGDSWWYVQWHAMSIDHMSITLGLFNVKVDIKCKETYSGDMKLCNMMKKWGDHDNGQWATSELRDTMCSEMKSTCSTMDRLYYAGWPPLFLFPAAAIFESMSLLLLYFHWHVKPTYMVRTLADKCGVLSSACGAFGFVAWFAIKPWLQGLPRMWGEMAGQMGATASVFTGFKEAFTCPFGWCFGAASFALVGTFMRVISQHNLPFHVDEPDPLGLDEDLNLLEEAKKEVERTYGTEQMPPAHVHAAHVHLK